ncbi:MAG: hypothetical protein ACOVO1_13265, partial [Chitinophagaceae bacterium]
TPTYLWSTGSTSSSIIAKPTTTTIYNVTVSYENGCSQIYYYALLVRQKSTSTTNITTCDSLIWNGITYKTSGTYTFKTLNAKGCDSTATLNLVIKNSTSSWLDIVACDSAFYNGTTYKTSGKYIFRTTNSVGCDSTSTLNITIKKSTSSTTTLSVCDSIIWNGVKYKQSGVYTFKTSNALGCDSTATLNLTVTSSPNAGIISGINNFCFGSGSTTLSTTGTGGSWSSNNPARVSVTTGGKVTATMGGNYTIYYVVVNSCGRDTAKFNIKVNVPSISTLSVTACGSYTWGGNVYTATGTYTKTGLVNVNGCDSTSNLDLTINPLPVITNVTASPNAICAGNSSVLNVSGNGGLITTGSPTDMWFNSPITFNNSSNVMLPNYVEFSRIPISTASTINSLWIELWQNAPAGVIFKMAIYTNDATTGRPSTLIQETNQVNNAGGNALINGRNQLTLNPSLVLQPGIYWVAAHWQGGNLPIKQYTGSIIKSYYNNRSYSLGFPTTVTSGQLTSESFVVGIGLRATSMTSTTATYSWSPSSTLSSSTGVSVTATPPSTRTYTVTAKNGFNCTASSQITVAVNNATTSTNNLSICANQTPYLWNGINYSNSGTYTKTGLTNGKGCDSTAVLNLTVLAPLKTTVNHKICETALPFTTNGLTFIEAGSQTLKLTGSNGCDSIVTHILSTLSDGIFDNATITQPQCDSV